ncbi:MAG: hypothetical protein J0J04_04730 [Microbacterium sp.]|uniref:hypothetical protein n=1 Tax=Microbacterium sp. TaxID=51671 RepID=UPI001ACA7B35|nr:hypothetical protein [Microbacterium sp.]MBN9214113.1 hypothetical protein [Microbacterium sp.]
MTTFNESLHPRGQAANAGQFRQTFNDAPASSLLIDDRFLDGELVVFNGDAGTESELDDVRGVEGHVTPLPLSEYDRAEAGAMYRFRSTDGSVQVDAFEHELTEVSQAPAADQPVNAFHELLHDVNTMGGDEIRSLDDDTLLRLDAYLLQAASRVQAARQERGLKHPKSDDALAVDQLALVDYRNITEDEIAKAWMAGVTQGKVGGVIRTKSDFYNHARDEHGEEDETVIDRAWATFTSEDGLEYHNEEGTWGGAEYLTWTNTVGEELDKAR